MVDYKHKLYGISYTILSDKQYESVLPKLATHFQQAFTFLFAGFIFLATRSPNILQDHTTFYLFVVAGSLGLCYTGCAVLDTLYRSKIGSIRLFGDLSIFTGFLSLWCLIVVLFGFYSLIVLAIILGLLWYGDKIFPDGKYRGQIADSRLKDVILLLGEKADSNAAVLHGATLAALIYNPDDPATDLLYKTTVAPAEKLEARTSIDHPKYDAEDYKFRSTTSIGDPSDAAEAISNSSKTAEATEAGATEAPTIAETAQQPENIMSSNKTPKPVDDEEKESTNTSKYIIPAMRPSKPILAEKKESKDSSNKLSAERSQSIDSRAQGEPTASSFSIRRRRFRSY